jgi:hypothetical protein
MEDSTLSRDGSGVYSLPAGSAATDGSTAEASQHNNPLNDLETDMNTPRPIVAGGSGASTVVGARTGFEIGGNVLAKSANYTALLVDRSKLIKSTATLTLSLTAAATLLDGWYVDVRADTGTTTIDPNGAETIDGAATLALSVGQTVRIRCDGSNFFTQFKTDSDQQNLNKGADVASATALTLGVDGNYFDITGTTTITSIAALGVGTVVKLHFDAALTLTHHATDLILPGADNIVTVAGDEAEFVEYASGDWICLKYLRTGSVPYHLIDEDSFTTNSDKRVPSQQSAKAYIDQQNLNYQALAQQIPSLLSKSANYTLLTTDRGNVVKSTATMTLTLPTVASAGNGFSFWVWNSSGVLTIDPNGSETIEGATTKVVTLNHKFLVFCDGTEWRTIAEVPFQRYFESSEQTITSAGALTLAHGLGAVPKLIMFEVICKTAEDGYSIGDLLAVSYTCTGGGANIHNTPTWDATNVYVRFSSITECFRVANKTTGGDTGLTNGNFRLIVRAWT